MVFMQSRERQITMMKWTNAGGQTKRANERSFVYRPPAWRRWRNVKTTYTFCHTDCCLGNQDRKLKLWSAYTVRLPDQWINKFWPLRYLFATLLFMYTMIVRWRNSLSALLLLKWITKSCWNSGQSVSECKHICHCGRFIFCILLSAS